MNVRVDLMMGIIMSLIIILIMYSLIQLFIDNNNIAKFIPAILIGMSALLASMTVMRSIENTNKNEVQKAKRDLFDRRLVYFNALSDYYTNIIDSRNISLVKVDELAQNVKRADLLFNDEIESYIKNLIYESKKVCSYENKIELLDRELYREREKTVYDNIKVESWKEEKITYNSEIKSFIANAENKKNDLIMLFDEYLNLKNH